MWAQETTDAVFFFRKHKVLEWLFTYLTSLKEVLTQNIAYPCSTEMLPEPLSYSNILCHYLNVLYFISTVYFLFKSSYWEIDYP